MGSCAVVVVNAFVQDPLEVVAVVGYDGDLRLSIVRLTIVAPSEDDASRQALEIVVKAFTVNGWTGLPEVRGVEQLK